MPPLSATSRRFDASPGAWYPTHMPAPEPTLSRDALLAEFHDYGVPSDEWRVGGEFERHLLRPSGQPVPYFGEHGIRWLFDRMAERGWKEKFEGDYPIALHRDGAWITLEPGRQFELSGSPSAHVADVVDESARFIAEVQDAIGDAPLHQVALGFTPYARIDEIPWVPKGRYVVMREHLGRVGDLAHHMMKGTAAVQASFDYADEADCARKVRLAVQLGPLTTALFANSPLAEGEPTGFASWRGHVWTRTDPARTGFPHAALEFSFERWLDYLLDVPMLFVQIGDQWRAAGDTTFRHWMEHGLEGTYPDHDDWELHMTSVFPEVRVKRHIEVRGADCVSMPLAGAFVALFKGLLYCEQAMSDAYELAERFASHGTQAERFDVACRAGLRGEIGSRRLASWAEALLEVASDGIERCDPEDLPWLQPLIAQVQTGDSPAEQVLRAWHEDPSPPALIDQFCFHPDNRA